jgi:hypothetical protein
MERQPQRPEGGSESRVSARGAIPGEGRPGQHDGVSDEVAERSGDRQQAANVEFGYLSLISPEGRSWSERVITRGIEDAQREDRPIDHRTASYVAAFLGGTSTPALRTLATTGAVYKASLEEEIVGVIFDQPAQVQTWIGWLANYCLNREDHRPVENWREDIGRQDRAEAELLRREHVLAELDDLFDRPPDDQLAGVEELGWSGLVRHDGRTGGWILNQARDDSRDVFETDSDAELAERWRDISEHYMDWYWRTRPYGTSGPGDGRVPGDDEERGTADPEQLEP